MSFRTYFLGLTPADRAAYAERAKSTVGYLTQIAYGNKQVDLGFADVLAAVSDGAIALADLPLTDRAIEQDGIRKAPTTEAAAQA